MEPLLSWRRNLTLNPPLNQDARRWPPVRVVH